MVEHRNQKALETRIAYQCAPVLTGIKISNILIISNYDRDKVIRLFHNTVISYHILYQSQEKSYFMLYRKSELITYLKECDVQEAMTEFGYYDYALTNILKEFSKRYSNYMLSKNTFPHEMGLILGYPVHDVIGFMNHQGKNFLYIGYWKVYEDLSNALVVFEMYHKAKEIVLQMLANGFSVLCILDRYNQHNKLEEIAI